MHRSLIALEKLANFALNVAGIWALVTMIVHAFEFADRDYDWDNPRDSYRYTRADFVVYGFSLVECVLALVAALSASLQRPPRSQQAIITKTSGKIRSLLDIP